MPRIVECQPTVWHCVCPNWTLPVTDPEPPVELFEVVINHEEQYSIWPVGKEIPAKWRTIGVRGSKEECLAHIKAVWTDMRPLSVRARHEGNG